MDSEVEGIRSEVEQLLKSRRDIDRLIERKNQLILKSLPGIYGFEDMDAFVSALSRFASEALRNCIQLRAGSSFEIKRRKPHFTSEVRAQVRKSLEANRPPSEIAREYGVSLATIANWRKLWGLPSRRTRTRLRLGRDTSDQ